MLKKALLLFIMSVSFVCTAFAINYGTLPSGMAGYKGTDYMQLDVKGTTINARSALTVNVTEAASFDKYFYLTSSSGNITTANCIYKTVLGGVTISNNVITGSTGKAVPIPSSTYSLYFYNNTDSVVSVTGNIIFTKR